MATIKGLMNTRSKADEYHGLSDITTISLSKDISDRFISNSISVLLGGTSYIFHSSIFHAI